jgi:AraC-like DNA-binding protein
LARRVRFEHTRDHLCRQPHSDLATLAHAYGYADQAHFGRDFKYFTHRTPGQFMAEIAGMPEALRYGVAFLPGQQREEYKITYLSYLLYSLYTIAMEVKP